MKHNLVMLDIAQERLSNSNGWQRVVANLYTALTGRLCVIVEKEGHFFAYITEVPVGVPPSVRAASQKAEACLLAGLEFCGLAQEKH